MLQPSWEMAEGREGALVNWNVLHFRQFTKGVPTPLGLLKEWSTI